ncbi:glycosyltransferase family 2 protein [Solibacillus isronensis]|uniref:glycosyltransferase family 2 protein n=1 Tax=Solibacillus isronensis TaxID=412383 RepID=UPI00203A3CB7|nr:glycosyltransferase family 2 protein [Solibacillus isronensis]MCM3722106.1 glycosyltransferase family 2 protein [Solibacillus isronensis]
MADLTTIILTYNEELNIEECIKSVNNISKRIIVIDSFSNDRTVEIARKLGAEVIQNKFVNHAKQFKFGLDASNIDTQWIFRIDADERLTKESAEEIDRLCNQNKDTDINGIIIRLEVNFLGKKLRHGGIYPIKVLRVFKHGIGNVEARNMDEHIILSHGKTMELKNDSLHNDYKDLSSWIDKHNKYSSREMMDYFENLSNTDNVENLNKSAKTKRIIKFKIYYKLPLGLRSLIYFIYRYFFKLGFLDGKEGLIFAVLQAFWYRFLVDSKIYEKNKKIVRTKERVEGGK